MKIVRRLLLVIVLMASALSLMADRQHLVKPGDTLYNISKRYNVTVEAIQAANPSVQGTNIQTGMMLNIPGDGEVLTVEETKASKDGKNKEKKALTFHFGKKKDKEKEKVFDSTSGKIVEREKEEAPAPVANNQPAETAPDANIFTSIRKKVFGAPDNIVVILPFNLDAQTSTDDKQQMRSVEFYEGMLLAVNEAQQRGQKILVQTYDLGTKSMNEILATSSLLDADLIVAPMEVEDVKPVAEFGKMHGINVISPFAFNAELSKNNKNLIQLNSSKSFLYPHLTKDILSRFKDYDFVILSDSSSVSKFDPYVTYLRKELKAAGKQYHEFPYRNPDRLASVDSALHISNRKILYIPEANSKDALRRMFPCLKCNNFNPEGQRTNDSAILGFPEWVLWTNDFMEFYYDMNVYMFSKMYTNPMDENVKQFYTDFRYWYAKEPMPLVPRYANLGYDVAKYFLAIIRLYGPTFDEHLVGFHSETLQTMMSFVHEGEGYINIGHYLVHFDPSTQIEKHEIK